MTAAFYGRTPARPDGQVPDAAVRFLSILHALSGAPDGPDAAAPVVNHEKVCRQLMAAHHRLLEILDPPGSSIWLYPRRLPRRLRRASRACGKRWLGLIELRKIRSFARWRSSKSFKKR